MKSMHEQSASNWAVHLCSLFDLANFLPSPRNVWDERAAGSSRHPNDAKVRDTDVLVGYLILFWMMLHLSYETCLNSLLRRMRFPLIQRNRIIRATWYCGFCSASICYMMSSVSQIVSVATHKQGTTHRELGIALHRSFYLHRAGIDMLRRGAWIKGCANVLFASFILNPHQENVKSIPTQFSANLYTFLYTFGFGLQSTVPYRWCAVTDIFLTCKTIDIVVINVCRILLCVLQTVGRPVCKLLFLSHCLTWIYLYLYYVPIFMLWSEEARYAGTEAGLWLWFAVECLDSVLLRLIGHAKATHWLEICLFPPPTWEAIELTGIHKRHRESLRKSNNNKTAKKIELWQTLVCAMTIKKKIKRIRQTKSNMDSATLDDSEKTKIARNVCGEQNVGGESI